MRHSNKIRKFGRDSDQRKALLASLARSLVLKERITTTEAKAKSLRPFMEKLISHGKKGTLASQRLIVSKLDKESGEKVIKVLGPKYKDRNGGFLRIIKLEPRESDASPMAIIEFV